MATRGNVLCKEEMPPHPLKRAFTRRFKDLAQHCRTISPRLRAFVLRGASPRVRDEERNSEHSVAVVDADDASVHLLELEPQLALRLFRRFRLRELLCLEATTPLLHRFISDNVKVLPVFRELALAIYTSDDELCRQRVLLSNEQSRAFRKICYRELDDTANLSVREASGLTSIFDDIAEKSLLALLDQHLPRMLSRLTVRFDGLFSMDYARFARLLRPLGTIRSLVWSDCFAVAESDLFAVLQQLTPHLQSLELANCQQTVSEGFFRHPLVLTLKELVVRVDIWSGPCQLRLNDAFLLGTRMRRLEIASNAMCDTRVTDEGLRAWIREWFEGRRDEARSLKLVPALFHRADSPWENDHLLKEPALPWKDNSLISKSGRILQLRHSSEGVHLEIH